MIALQALLADQQLRDELREYFEGEAAKHASKANAAMAMDPPQIDLARKYACKSEACAEAVPFLIDYIKRELKKVQTPDPPGR